MNSISNKLEFLSEHARGNINVLMVSETKAVFWLQTSQFIGLVHRMGLIVILKMVESCYTKEKIFRQIFFQQIKSL